MGLWNFSCSARRYCLATLKLLTISMLMSILFVSPSYSALEEDFEGAFPWGWNTFDACGASNCNLAVSTDAHTGSYSLKIQMKSDSGKELGLWRKFSGLKPNTTGNVTIRYKIPDGGNSWWMEHHVWLNSGEPTAFPANKGGNDGSTQSGKWTLRTPKYGGVDWGEDSGTGNVWEARTISITTNAKGEAWIGFVAGSWSASKDILIDSIDFASTFDVAVDAVCKGTLTVDPDEYGIARVSAYDVDNGSVPAAASVYLTSATNTTINRYVVENDVSSVRVMSMVDGNVISKNGVQQAALNRGQYVDISVVAADMISGTKPYCSDYNDLPTLKQNSTLVPAAFAGRKFAVYCSRDTGKLAFRALGQAATVTIYENGLTTVKQVVSVGANSTAESVALTNAAVYVVISTAPVLVHYQGATASDGAPIPPADREIYGVPSANAHLVFADDNTTYTWYKSDGTVGGTGTANAGTRVQIVGVTHGNAFGVRVVADKPVAATQVGDADGSDMTSWYPKWALARSFVIPRSAEYCVVVPQEPGATITVVNSDGSLGLTDGTYAGGGTGTSPGFKHFGSTTSVSGSIAAGTTIYCSKPAFVYFEPDDDDEANLNGDMNTLLFLSSGQSTVNLNVANIYGVTDTCSTAVTVNSACAAPTITTQPSNQSKAVGQTATFSVAATGTAPLSYQWQKMPSGGSWTDISGATSSSYTTPTLALSDHNSQFRCKVTNICGDVTSNAATLTVGCTPPAAPTGGTATVNSVSQITWGWTVVPSVTGEVYRVYDAETGGVLKATSAADAALIAETGLSVNTLYTRWVATYKDCESTTRLALPAKYTFANVPGAPVVDGVTISTFNVAISSNGNPASTTYAIKVVEGTNTSYVQADGTLGTTAAWQTESVWESAGGKKTVTGLAQGTTYTVSVAARNGDNVLTNYSTTADATTLQLTPLGPATGFVEVADCSSVARPAYWDGDFGSPGGKFSVATYTSGLTTEHGGSCVKAQTSDGTSYFLVKKLMLKPNTTGKVRVWLAVPPGGSSHWIEAAYKVGTETNFNENSSTWTMIKKFDAWGLGTDNGGVWTEYEGNLTTDASGRVNIGIKAGGGSATAYWDCWSVSENLLDLEPPTVTIDQATGQADPTTGLTINFTVVFSEPITGFDANDVVVTGTAGGTKTVIITGTGPTYNVAVSGMTSSGTVIVSIPAGAAVDAFGNQSLASTSTDNQVTYSYVTLPNAPTNPTTVDVGSDSIRWSWTDNSSDETCFKVYAGPGATAPTTVTDTTAADVTYWDHTGLTVNTQYAFQVAATNTMGDSAKTANISAWTLANVPSAPVVDGSTSDSLTVAIGADDGNPATTQYAIQISPALGGDSWVQPNGTVGSTEAWKTAAEWGTVTVSTLASSTEYTFKAKARNGADVETALSDGATGTTCYGDEMLANGGLTRALTGGGFCQSNPGAFAGWTLISGQTWYDDNRLKANSMGCTNPATAVIAQTFGMTTGGKCYTASFKMRHDNYPEGAWNKGWGKMTVYYFTDSSMAVACNPASDTTGNITNATNLDWYTIRMAKTTPADCRFVLVEVSSHAEQFSGSNGFTDVDDISFKTDGSAACSAPVITISPANQTACAGTGVTFSVTATGTAPLSYQWRKGTANITGANEASYAILSVATGDAGSYDCLVSNACGSAVSGAATLTVNVGPSITTQPASQTRCAGESVTFTVAATGTAPLSYQWKKDNTDITGATSASYTINSVATGDAAGYTCEVTNGCGSVTSNSATLTVNTAPVISTQPVSQTICSGQTATLTVTAAGTAPLAYQWKKDEADIPGATSESYVANAAGSYTCIVTNGCGSVTSDAAVLTVNTPPSITAQPQSQTVCQGQSANFSVTADGTAPLTYQWQKDGVDISGAASASYVATEAGSYTCVVTNSCGSVTSDAGVLTIAAIPSVVSITPSTVGPTSADSIDFEVVFSEAVTDFDDAADVTVNNSGTANAAVAIAANSGTSYTVTVSGITGDGSLSLSVNADAAQSSAGCGNTAGGPSAAVAIDNTAPYVLNVTSSKADGVYGVDEVIDVQVVMSEPVTVDTASGSPTITLETGDTDRDAVYVSGSGTDTLVFEYVVHQDDASPDLDYTAKDALTLNGAVIEDISDNIANITLAQPGTAGSLADNKAIVIETCTAPVVTSDPVGATICSGQTATLTVTAAGTAPLSYQWKKNGVEITAAVSDSFIANEAGSYTCVVSNGCGSDESEAAVVVVNTAPSVITQPVSQTICSGDTIVFSIVASGTDPLGYQWQKEGVDIIGATSASYTASEAGSYACVVTNTCGSAISDAAVLTVNAAPNILFQPQSMTICQGGNAVFSIFAEGTAPLTYQWQKDGVDIVDATSSEYAATQAGDYTCVVSNSCGSVISAVATLTVGTHPEVVSITPSTVGPTNADSIDFEVVFSEAVTDFDDAADVTVNNSGTANAAVAITANSETSYTVTVSGITGDGSLSLSVNADAAQSTAVGCGSLAGGPSAAVTIDNTAPTVPALELDREFTNSTDVSATFSGSTDANGVEYKLKLDSGSFETATSPSVVPVAGLAEGSHTVVVVAVDPAGNTSDEASASFTVDITNPVASVVSILQIQDCELMLPSDYRANQGEVAIFFTADDLNLDGTPTIAVKDAANNDIAVAPVTFNEGYYRAVATIDAATANGAATVTISAVDKAGNTITDTAQFNVNKAQVVVDIQLGQVVTGPLTRCITFRLGNGLTAHEMPMPVEFTDGVAQVVLKNIPYNQAWTCISAKDKLHTLRRTVALSGGENDQYGADMTGIRALVGGDLTNDNKIDILDFGAFVGQYGRILGPVDCDFFGRHPDISGNGTVGTDDFTFIQTGFLTLGDYDCQGTVIVSQPRTAVTVAAARAAGIAEAEAADVNRDGIIDLKDVAIWTQLNMSRGR